MLKDVITSAQRDNSHVSASAPTNILGVATAALSAARVDGNLRKTDTYSSLHSRKTCVLVNPISMTKAALFIIDVTTCCHLNELNRTPANLFFVYPLSGLIMRMLPMRPLL